MLLPDQAPLAPFFAATIQIAKVSF